MTAHSEALALQARSSAIKMCAQANASHIGSALSCIDLLAVLYAGAASITPENQQDQTRDVVLVSKGHAAAGLYAVLAHSGFIPQEDLTTYCGDGSMLSGHITANVPGVELSTGSLGHALAFGCGIALSRKRQERPGHVFAILSDGECDEGSIWESALFANHHRLDNLTAIIDRNGLQSLGPTEETLGLEPLPDKWRAFGWQVSEVDGHDHDQLWAAATARSHSPQVIIASTVKGRGVSFMEGAVLWHYRSPQGSDLAQALLEIGTRTHA